MSARWEGIGSLQEEETRRTCPISEHGFRVAVQVQKPGHGGPTNRGRLPEMEVPTGGEPACRHSQPLSGSAHLATVVPYEQNRTE